MTGKVTVVLTARDGRAFERAFASNEEAIAEIAAFLPKLDGVTAEGVERLREILAFRMTACVGNIVTAADTALHSVAWRHETEAHP